MFFDHVHSRQKTFTKYMKTGAFDKLHNIEQVAMLFWISVFSSVKQEEIELNDFYGSFLL